MFAAASMVWTVTVHEHWVDETQESRGQQKPPRLPDAVLERGSGVRLSVALIGLAPFAPCQSDERRSNGHVGMYNTLQYVLSDTSF